jgi:hypothetical protein
LDLFDLKWGLLNNELDKNFLKKTWKSDKYSETFATFSARRDHVLMAAALHRSGHDAAASSSSLKLLVDLFVSDLFESDVIQIS